MPMVVAVVWEFEVKNDAIAEFRRVHGPEGDWAALFRRHAGYEETTLLQSAGDPARFLTIDRWESAMHYERMKRAAAVEYARLDTACEALTISEREIGLFEVA